MSPAKQRQRRPPPVLQRPPTRAPTVARPPAVRTGQRSAALRLTSAAVCYISGDLCASGGRRARGILESPLGGRGGGRLRCPHNGRWPEATAARRQRLRGALRLVCPSGAVGADACGRCSENHIGKTPAGGGACRRDARPPARSPRAPPNGLAANAAGGGGGGRCGVRGDEPPRRAWRRPTPSRLPVVGHANAGQLRDGRWRPLDSFFLLRFLGICSPT